MGNFTEYNAPIQVTDAEDRIVAPGSSHMMASGTYETATGEFRNAQMSMQSSEIKLYNGNILSTLRTPYGSTATDKTTITDKHLVKVGNVEMSVAQAKSMGFIEGENQNLKETTRTIQESIKENTKETARTSLVDFSVGNNGLGMLRHHVGEQTMLAVQHSVIGHLNRVDQLGNPVDGVEALDRAAASMANRIPGMEPDMAKSMIDSMVNTYSKNAANFITGKHGVDGQKVIEWAADNLKPQEKQRVYQALILGNYHVLDTLTRQAKPYIK